MNSKNMQISIAILLVGILIVGFAGCNGKSGTGTDSSEIAKTVGEVTTTTPVTQTTQTMCPIMGKPINKAVSIDYQDKKVYFCCPPCIDKFKAEPAKYVKDLPQFKK